MVFIKVRVREETLASDNCVDPIKKGIPADQVSLDIILRDIDIFDNVEATGSSFILPSINHQASTCQNSFVNPAST